MQIHGECEARFDAVKKVLADSIESGEDLGASFAVYEHGKKVVDLWGGHLDEERTKLWQENTPSKIRWEERRREGEEKC